MADLWYMYMYLAAAKLAVFRRNFYFGGFVVHVHVFGGSKIGGF